MSTTSPANLTGARKAAILMSLLGEDAAATVLRNLPQRDLQTIAEEVAGLGSVPLELTLQVLEEYQQMMSVQESIAIGGQDTAKRLLIKTLGEAAASSMVEKLGRTLDATAVEVDSLKKADPQKLARFLVGERTQTKALVLRHLDAKQASALLMKMDPDVRTDCVRRLASLGQFSPEVAGKVSAVLNRRLRAVADQGMRIPDFVASRS